MAVPTGDAPTLGQNRDTAATLKEQAKQATHEVVETAQQKGGELFAQTKEQVRTQLGSTKEQVISQVETHKAQAADTLQSVGQALRNTGDSLKSEGQSNIASYAETFANELDGLTSYVRDRDLERIAADAEDFARRRPALFLGAAFLLGVGLARFFKSSAPTQTAGSDLRRFSDDGPGYASGGLPAPADPASESGADDGSGLPLYSEHTPGGRAGDDT